MKLRIGRKSKLIACSFICSLCCEAQAQIITSNPLEYAAITEGNNLINSQINSQLENKQKTATLQGTIAAEFTKIREWERKYNSYLKTADGYASSLKACTSLYNEGVQIFMNLCSIRKDLERNPQGIAATLSMNDLYMETATEMVSVYNALKDAIAMGGKENMLTGADRSKTLWALNDKMESFQKGLRQLHLSLRYYTMNDVWNSVSAGMIDRDNGEVARQALGRWKRCAMVAGRN